MEPRFATGFNHRKQRGSILLAAGDVFGLTAKRKRASKVPSSYKPPLATLDDVLEISAERRPSVTDELERERLRDAAAQAVGLSTYQDDGASFRSSAQSNRSNLNRSPLPPFPAPLSAFHPSLTQHSSALLKFIPNTGPFLLRSKSKQWKTRHLVLTSTTRPSRDQSATEAHLHLFKSASADEKELERLRIHQDSVVYIADEEIGNGRKFVVKVGGRAIVDYSNNNAPPTPSPDEPLTVWLMQMPDATQMQRWIQFIKSSVLMQRAERAGIGSTFHNTYNTGGPELRGDLDVMLSMGKQGLLSSPAQPVIDTTSHASAPNQAGTDEATLPRSRQVSSPTASSAAVTALKGLFNAAPRPHSKQFSSSGTSLGPLTINTQGPPEADSQNHASIADDHQPALAPRSSNLFHLFRPKSPQPTNIVQPLSPPVSPIVTGAEESATANGPISPTQSITSRYTGAVPTTPSGNKKLNHSSSFSMDWETSADMGSSVILNDRRISTASTSLAPPPRTRRPWTASTISNHQRLAKEKSSSTLTELLSPVDSEGYQSQKGDAATETVDVLDDKPRSLILPVTDESGESRTNLASDAEIQPSAIPSPMMTTTRTESSASSFVESASFHNRQSMEPPRVDGNDRRVSRTSTSSSYTSEENEDNLTASTNAQLSTKEHELENDLARTPSNYRRRMRNGPIPKQMSPPSGPLPLPPSVQLSPLPRATSPALASEDRSQSPASVASTVPSLAGNAMSLGSTNLKRMSAVSVSSARSSHSVGSGSTNLSKQSASILPGGSTFMGSTGRLSIISSSPMSTQQTRSSLPPPRPAPSNPLPPPPSNDDSASVTRGGLLTNRSNPSSSAQPLPRSELGFRSARYSLVPPTPPPIGALPPRPDEIAPLSKPNQSSHGAKAQHLYTISDEESLKNDEIMSTALTRPLPASPTAERPPSPSPSANSVHSTKSSSSIGFKGLPSLRFRLRMLSAPTESSISRLPPVGPPPSQPLPSIPVQHKVQERPVRHSDDGPLFHHTPLPPALPFTPLDNFNRQSNEPYYARHNYSAPSTAASWKLAHVSSLSASALPSTMPHFPSASYVRPLPVAPERTALSPPPRRNSRASREVILQQPPDRERESFEAPLQVLGEAPSMHVQHSAINLVDIVEASTDSQLS